MSRIYQGGTSNRRFQSNKQSRGFNPTQVQGNIKRIQQEGQAALQDLKTQDRERQRQDQMSDLQRNAGDRAAQLDLQKERIAEEGQFKIQQAVERYEVQNAQMLDNNSLKLRQFADKASFDLLQMGERSSFQNEQISQRNELKLDQMDENFRMNMDHAAQRANATREQAAMQAQFAQDRANQSKQQAGVSALLSFANIALQGADLAYKQSEKQAREEEVRQQKMAELDALGLSFIDSESGSIVTSAGTPNPTLTQQTNQQSIEQAEESAIVQQSGGNSIVAENIRQPLADQTMDRDLRQASVGEASIRFGSDFSTYISSPETTALVGGQPRTLASLRSRAELHEWLNSAAGDLTAAYGISGKDKHAVILQYGRAVKQARDAAYRDYGGLIAQARKQEGYDGAYSNARTLMHTGNSQEAYQALRNGYVVHGMGMGKSPKEINTEVFKDLLSMAKNPDDLKQVLKIPGRAGTEFGNQREYADMITAEKTRRLRVQNQYDGANQTFVNNKIKVVQQNTARALFNAKSGEQSANIRQEAAAQLRALGPQGYDAANAMEAKGGENQAIFNDIKDRIRMGNPPSTEELQGHAASGALGHTMLKEIKGMGLLADQVETAVTSAGLDMDTIVSDAVDQGLASRITNADNRKSLAAGIEAYYGPRIKDQLKAFVIGKGGNVTSLEIQQEAQRLQQGVIKDLINTGDSRLKKDSRGIYTFDYGQENYISVPMERNPLTGKVQRVYSRRDVAQIPSTASIADQHLTSEELLEAVEVWDRGGSDYSLRIKAIAKKLNTTPLQLIRAQGVALGYPDLDEVPQAIQQAQPTGLKDGFNALQSMGFPTKGAAYLAGNIMQESSWQGQRSWGQVLNDGSDRNGGLISWMDDAQRNHFRLTKIEKYLGKSISDASASEQLQAMVWEMKNTPYYQEAYRIFMNPSATETQLKRASKRYWGYGHEGDRYAYARGLL